MGVILPLLGSVVLFVASYLLLKHLALRKRLAGVNQPRSFPILGHALICKPDPTGFINQVMGMGQLYPKEPRMVLIWLGPLPTLMVYSGKLLEPIFSTSKHMNKGLAYTFLIPWLGYSLLISAAERWRPKRKILTPTFHYDILRDFIPIFNEHAKILTKKFEKIAESDNPVVEVLSSMTLCTLDVICETSMGRSVNAQTQKDSEYVMAVHTINDIVQDRTKNPLVWPEFLFKWIGQGKLHDKCLGILHSFTRKVIEERHAELVASGWRLEGRRAFLDMLLEMAHKGEFPMEDIQGEVDTFMFEGHDTTSTALSWALHLIGNYPETQKKLHEELDKVLGERNYVSVEDLSELRYTECCLKEALRLYPSVPIITRELGEDQEIGGTVFPKGMTILLNQYLVHRDPAQWEDPERFIPERFFPENSIGRHAFSFVPFSAGSRNCIGQRFAIMEMKVILAWIMRHFKVQSVEAVYEVRPKIELIIRPIGGLHVNLIPRRRVPN